MTLKGRNLRGFPEKSVPVVTLAQGLPLVGLFLDLPSTIVGGAQAFPMECWRLKSGIADHDVQGGPSGESIPPGRRRRMIAVGLSPTWTHV
jgi:hypothetical protein